MTIRCKFTVDSVTHHAHNNSRILLRAIYDESIPEDQRFSKATPSGTLEFWTNTPGAVAELVPGRSFYLDLIPVAAIEHQKTSVVETPT